MRILNFIILATLVSASAQSETVTCEKVQSYLSGQYETMLLACNKAGKDNTDCFDEINKARTSGKNDLADNIISTKYNLILSSLDSYDFKDISQRRLMVMKDASIDQDKKNAELRLLSELEKLKDLNKNEVVFACLKSCNNEKSKIEAYNSQLRGIRSEIEGELINFPFLYEKFFIANAKSVIFNAASDIASSFSKSNNNNQALDLGVFTQDLKKWTSATKSDNSINKTSCCTTSVEFWCSNVGKEFIDHVIQQERTSNSAANNKGHGGSSNNAATIGTKNKFSDKMSNHTAH
jgi:hypothetical protein